MGNIELSLKVLINKVYCLLGAVNLSGSIIIMYCKKRSYPLDSSSLLYSSIFFRRFTIFGGFFISTPFAFEIFMILKWDIIRGCCFIKAASSTKKQ